MRFKRWFRNFKYTLDEVIMNWGYFIMIWYGIICGILLSMMLLFTIFG